MVKQLAFVFLFVVFDGIFGLRVSHAQPPRSPEEIWRSLEGLSPAQRERLLVKGAKTEDGIVWYTNSSQRNAARYIREFTRSYPFTDPRVWRGKSRDVTQRIIAEALSARFSVDVVKPSIDLLAPLLHRNLIGRYESPLRAALSPWARGPLWTNINYAYRVFAFNPKKLAREDVPASWEDLLQPRFRGAILFDESSLHEVISLLAAWGREKTVNYFDRLSRQRLLICTGRDTMLAMMMAGEAPVAITAYAYHSEALRARGAPIDWMAEDVIPTLVYPLALARHAPHPYTAALFYDFLISERGQRMIAEDGRVVAHPNVQPIYPRMKGLQASLAAEQTQINSLARTEKYFREALRILDSVVLKRER